MSTVQEILKICVTCNNTSGLELDTCSWISSWLAVSALDYVCLCFNAGVDIFFFCFLQYWLISQKIEISNWQPYKRTNLIRILIINVYITVPSISVIILKVTSSSAIVFCLLKFDIEDTSKESSGISLNSHNDTTESMEESLLRFPENNDGLLGYLNFYRSDDCTKEWQYLKTISFCIILL